MRLNVDVIVVAGTGATAAAKQATSTIPIVVRSAGDLVGAGLVASLAKPGGNITGSADISPDLSGKRLEFLYAFGLSIGHRSVLIGGISEAPPTGEPTMRKALPVMTEDAEHLKQRLQRTYDGRQKPRLQMLY
jgi:hypothetical protein